MYTESPAPYNLLRGDEPYYPINDERNNNLFAAYQELAEKEKGVLFGDESRTQFSTIKDFTDSILRKTNQISLDPMEYVERTMVAYKNPGHNFATPYMTSNYSGMLFNSYC